ncbi:hypothetical protein AAFF_G00149940 [Aldrovandia affinis]|uniref:Uncharacterized protein n=1 Tax=Aldrovandia affinis TaxID=143900 RepID=A0AAD7RPE7_9TELE|nr:hypothetical protein AAFF_G00149940 [Aldrovandia affinis]
MQVAHLVQFTRARFHRHVGALLTWYLSNSFCAEPFTLRLPRARLSGACYVPAIVPFGVCPRCLLSVARDPESNSACNNGAFVHYLIERGEVKWNTCCKVLTRIDIRVAPPLPARSALEMWFDGCRHSEETHAPN